jgi:hypothetical protein
MASIEASLQTRLAGYAGLSALVAARIYPEHLPQNPTYPSVVFERQITERESAMGSDVGVVAAVFSVESHGSTFASAMAVATQVLGALQRYSGTVDSIVILDSFVTGEDQDYDPETGTYSKRLDFQVWHRE